MILKLHLFPIDFELSEIFVSEEEVISICVGSEEEVKLFA